MKGAPERVFAKCITIIVNGENQPITSQTVKAFDKANARYMKQGRRVLAMACRRLSHVAYVGMTLAEEEQMYLEMFQRGDLIPESPSTSSGLILVGCTALEDPPKLTVPGAVLRCREAGIRVVMVTGDHPATAQAIAKQCNIFGMYKTREDVEKVRGVEVLLDDTEVRNEYHNAVAGAGAVDCLSLFAPHPPDLTDRGRCRHWQRAQRVRRQGLGTSPVETGNRVRPDVAP